MFCNHRAFWHSLKFCTQGDCLPCLTLVPDLSGLPIWPSPLQPLTCSSYLPHLHTDNASLESCTRLIAPTEPFTPLMRTLVLVRELQKVFHFPGDMWQSTISLLSNLCPIQPPEKHWAHPVYQAQCSGLSHSMPKLLYEVRTILGPILLLGKLRFRDITCSRPLS